MSPDVNANPDDLRRFARDVQKSVDEYRQISRNLRKRLASTKWDDAERRKFEADLETSLKAIERFAEQLRAQHIPTLQRRAAALDAYMRR